MIFLKKFSVKNKRAVTIIYLIIIIFLKYSEKAYFYFPPKIQVGNYVFSIFY